MIIEYFTIDVNAESKEEADELIDSGEYGEYDHNHDSLSLHDEIEFEEEINPS